MASGGPEHGPVGSGAYQVRLSGEIDILHERTLGRVAEGYEASDAADVLVDLEPVEFMDSTGLSFLLRLRRTAQARGGRVSVEGARPTVRRTMQIVGFHLLIDGVTSESETPQPT